MPRVEDAMAEALVLMRVAGLAEYGRGPKTPQDAALQVKAYLVVLEAEVNRVPNWWGARVSAALIHGTALAAITQMSEYPTALMFAELAVKTFKAGMELLAVAVDGGEEFLLYTVERGAGESARDMAKTQALARSGLAEALPAKTSV